MQRIVSQGAEYKMARNLLRNIQVAVGNEFCKNGAARINERKLREVLTKMQQLSQPADIKPRPEVYCTMITSDGFLPGALVLAVSLRRAGATRPAVVMVTEDVSAAARTKLAVHGYHVIAVPNLPLPAGVSSHVPAWEAVGYTKLRLWQLEQFKRIVYLDADTVVKEPIEELFALRLDPALRFAAAPDLLPPDHFNAGMLVVEPDRQVFRRMLLTMARLPSYDGGDTGFLNAFFPSWYTSSYRDTRLSFGYNAQRTLQWFTRAKPAYWDTISPLKIVHYSSSPKPWEVAPDKARGPLERDWWHIHRTFLGAPATTHQLPVFPGLPHEARLGYLLEYVDEDERDKKTSSCSSVSTTTASTNFASSSSASASFAWQKALELGHISREIFKI
eukprot:g39500.t1